MYSVFSSFFVFFSKEQHGELMREKDYSTRHVGVFRNKKLVVVQRTTFQFRVYNKTLNKKKAERKKHREKKRRRRQRRREPNNNKIYGEHTIRPVALVGGVGVRPRRV